MLFIYNSHSHVAEQSLLLFSAQTAGKESVFFQPGSSEARNKSHTRHNTRLARPLKVAGLLTELCPHLLTVCWVFEDKHSSEVSSERVVTWVWTIIYNGVIK